MSVKDEIFLDCSTNNISLGTNWYVITGGPSSGKSKLMDALAFEGFAVRPEAARILIDEQMSQGQVLSQIREDEHTFQLLVLQMKIDVEAAANPNELIFWERGIPDSIAYLEQCEGDSDIARQAIQRRYKGIFLLDRLPIYESDYARTEDELQAAQIHEGLRKAYTNLGYDVIAVPALPISARLQFIISAVLFVT